MGTPATAYSIIYLYKKMKFLKLLFLAFLGVNAHGPRHISPGLWSTFTKCNKLFQRDLKFETCHNKVRVEFGESYPECFDRSYFPLAFTEFSKRRPSPGAWTNFMGCCEVLQEHMQCLHKVPAKFGGSYPRCFHEGSVWSSCINGDNKPRPF